MPTPTAQAAAGLAACVGHSWPVFAQFRGGKAVATAAGALVVVSPKHSHSRPQVVSAASSLTRTVSVGSLAAAGVGTVGGVLASLRTHDPVPVAFASLAATLVVVRHIPNIRRLARGEEPKLSSRLLGGS